jgi:DNA-binding NtrC family response regulator
MILIGRKTQETRAELHGFAFKTVMPSHNPKRAIMGKVVLVHHDPKTAAIIAKQLMQMGFSVVTDTKDANSAYKTIRLNNPDMVVIDDWTFDRGGYTIVKALRAVRSTKTLPIIFVGNGEILSEEDNLSFTTVEQLSCRLNGSKDEN